MEIKYLNKTVIITPFTPIMDKHETSRLENEFTKLKDNKIGIDMRFVENCTIDFINFINKQDKIGIFNIQSDIFALFNIMNCDKLINLYTTEENFINNKYRVLNRNLKIA